MAFSWRPNVKEVEEGPERGSTGYARPRTPEQIAAVQRDYNQNLHYMAEYHIKFFLDEWQSRSTFPLDTIIAVHRNSYPREIQFFLLRDVRGASWKLESGTLALLNEEVSQGIDSSKLFSWDELEAMWLILVNAQKSRPGSELGLTPEWSMFYSRHG